VLPLKHLGGFINRFGDLEQYGRAVTDYWLIIATSGCLQHSAAVALHQALQALPLRLLSIAGWAPVLL
jgi:hypothetical protein